MDFKEYLAKQGLHLPEWLKNYQKDRRPSIREVLSTSRIVFYPGARFDGGPIVVFNKGHFGDVYLYADYMVTKEMAMEHMTNKDCCYGYHLLDMFDINEREMYINGFKTEASLVDKSGKRYSFTYDKHDFSHVIVKPYSLLAVFERDEEFDESHGCKRFAILYTSRDAFFTFYNLFRVHSYKDRLKAIAIRDHGFGCNYDHFSNGGLLESMANEIGVRPPYILIEPSQKPWEGYEHLEDVTDNTFIAHEEHYPHQNVYKNARPVRIKTKNIFDIFVEDELTTVINDYQSGLTILDEYDHQCLKTPKGSNTIYEFTYEDCLRVIQTLKLYNQSKIFGVEKRPGQLEGIVGSVYQTAFGEEMYKSAEEKAAHLLYFVIKDHPFVDGCKRIAATLFLEFLNKNHILKNKNRELVIDPKALAALTLLIAESDPGEMSMMIKVIMVFLTR